VAGSVLTSNAPNGGVPTSWATFSESADEAGISRRYGGIHFMVGDLEGRRVGKQIGKAAFDRTARLISGAPGQSVR
jgi:hypothetical protein